MRHNDREMVKTRQFLFSSCGVLKIENVIFLVRKKINVHKVPFLQNALRRDLTRNALSSSHPHPVRVHSLFAST